MMTSNVFGTISSKELGYAKVNIIDGTLVRDILHDPVDSAMARSIKQIA